MSGQDGTISAIQAKTIARIGVTVALLAVSAWATIPLGAVPFTLQTVVLSMIPAMFGTSAAVASVAAYVLLGALGLPVFSSFMGGLGVLAGPTGGFLWGFVIGVAVAGLVERLLRPVASSPFIRTVIADMAMLLIAYACGTAQLMMVGSLDLVPALMAAVLPFVVPDVVKLAVGARVGCAVSRALDR